ncbi:hypothetical protein B0H63DRAFT_486249 [Podospora didyma]|uniref:Secreted protein n=1 Tax=Podospora didyma TaxID=330526 RepID=A0AAE0K4W4_9PEZI|nr:hypothetical protein B0H63DRAFT_486249 [Podospora didyma]
MFSFAPCILRSLAPILSCLLARNPSQVAGMSPCLHVCLPDALALRLACAYVSFAVHPEEDRSKNKKKTAELH